MKKFQNIFHAAWMGFDFSWITCILGLKITLTTLKTFLLMYFDWLGLQRGAGGTSARVRSERDPTVVGRQARGQTRAAAQSHPADFAPKCPGCRTSGQVVGPPLQSVARGDPLRGASEPD